MWSAHTAEQQWEEDFHLPQYEMNTLFINILQIKFKWIHQRLYFMCSLSVPSHEDKGSADRSVMSSFSSRCLMMATRLNETTCACLSRCACRPGRIKTRLSFIILRWRRFHPTLRTLVPLTLCCSKHFILISEFLLLLRKKNYIVSL